MKKFYQPVISNITSLQFLQPTMISLKELHLKCQWKKFFALMIMRRRITKELRSFLNPEENRGYMFLLPVRLRQAQPDNYRFLIKILSIISFNSGCLSLNNSGC